MATNPKLVFVVENDHFHEEMIHQQLDSDLKHEFVYFEHSKDCLDALHRHPVAVFVDYDLKMIDNGEMDAIKFLDKIKELEHNTEVVMFSTHESMELANNALKHGAYDYIVINDYKYLKFKQILRNIDKHFSYVHTLKKEKSLIKTFFIAWVVVVAIFFTLWATGILKPVNDTLVAPW